MSAKIARRTVIKGALGTLVAGAGFARAARSQAVSREEIGKALYPARGLPGGGQLEIRMEVSGFHSDPDVLEVAQRYKPYNLESWHTEWTRVAAKNEELAARFESEGHKVTANQFYLRAVDFHRRALVYMADTDSRMLPTYARLRQNFDKAWSLVRPPFERVEIPYEGQMLEAHFYAARGPAGQRAPVVYNYSGADGILLRGNRGRARQYLSRGMAFLDVDGPGHGGSLRLKRLYMPPDTERVVKAVIDYLLTRPDIDPNRIAVHGSSMGGYSVPRAAAVDKRIQAVAVWSGAFSLVEDIFDYYPPIQDRLRWLIGAKDLAEARRKLRDYTLVGRAEKIECPLLVGYNLDDRIMDPRGALRLYEESRNAKREIIEGVGHGDRPFALRTYIADWFAKQLRAA